MRWFWPALVMACGGADREDSGPRYQEFELVVADSWSQLEAEADPWSDQRPVEVVCTSDGFHAEGDSFVEVDTGACNWLSAVQASKAPLFAGDTVIVDFYHLPLIADEVAETVVELRADDEVLWTLVVPLSPDASVDAETYTAQITAQRDHPKGTPIYFHLHNHGYNSYALTSVVVRTPR